MDNILNKLKQNWITIACVVAIVFFAGLMVSDLNSSTQPATKQVQQQQYVGSINSDKFHYPDCRWAQNIHEENEVWFSSREEAIDSGYVPCQTCRP